MEFWGQGCVFINTLWDNAWLFGCVSVNVYPVYFVGCVCDSFMSVSRLIMMEEHPMETDV